MPQDIKERTFDFALRIINLSNHLPKTKAGNVLGNQVLRAGTSIGANVEEAEAAYTKESFTYKMNIALKRSTRNSLLVTTAQEIENCKASSA